MALKLTLSITYWAEVSDPPPFTLGPQLLASKGIVKVL